MLCFPRFRGMLMFEMLLDGANDLRMEDVSQGFFVSHVLRMLL